MVQDCSSAPYIVLYCDPTWGQGVSAKDEMVQYVADLQKDMSAVVELFGKGENSLLVIIKKYGKSLRNFILGVEIKPKV